MNSEERNMSGVIIFIVIILILAIGGYYLITHKDLYTKTKEETKQEEIVKSIKFDETKDYIYFTNEEVLDEHEGLIYKEIYININSEEAKELQVTLNNYMNSIKDNVVKENDEIISAQMVSYEFHTTSKYLVLSTNDYTYLNDETKEFKSKLDYYIFDLSNGNLLDNRDIMKKENITDQEIRTKIREYISDDENVDIDATMNNDYVLSISKSGKVVINIVVKTLEMDYNVGIEMD